MIPSAVHSGVSKPESLRRRRGFPAAVSMWAIAALSMVLHPAVPLGAQASGGLRAELAGQTALPDFSARLAAAADRAAGVAELLSLLEEFIPKVQDGPGRRSLLLRWAAVLELTGRWEEAAARYEEAAFAAPGQRDMDSLLSAARAWLAAGETEKALSILRILGVASTDAGVRTRSLILEGWARLFEGSAAEARSLAARAASATPDRESLLSALTLLWAASEGRSREEAGARIRKEFPGTPEAAMAGGGPVPPAAHWLLTPAAGGAKPPDAPTPGTVAAAAPKPSGTAPAPEEPRASPAADAPGPAAPAPASGSPPESSRVKAFQTGAFSDESNAALLVRELSGKGFEVVVERRERGGKPLWVVLVPPGPDSQATLLRLKDSGYEAYPIF